MGKEYRKQTEVVSTINIPTLALLEDDLTATLLKWELEGTTGSAISRDATKAYNGEASLKCLTRDSGEVNGDYAYAKRFIQLTNRRHFNLKFAVRGQMLDSRSGTLYFAIQFMDSLGWGKAEFKIDDLAKKLYYYNTADGWTELADYVLVSLPNLWYRIEIQVDRIARKYEYILIGESEPDVKDIPFYNSDFFIGSSYIMIYLGVIQNQASHGDPAMAHYDDIVLMTPDQ